ncbi:alpha/beta hydrolase [Streptomyces sp. M19]
MRPVSHRGPVGPARRNGTGRAAERYGPRRYRARAAPVPPGFGAGWDHAELQLVRRCAARVPGPARARGRAGGPPLVCLAGARGGTPRTWGPRGLDARRELIVPDGRGTGGSPPPEDPTGYAFPSLAEDVEALRRHLGLERIALLGHSAGRRPRRRTPPPAPSTCPTWYWSAPVRGSRANCPTTRGRSSTPARTSRGGPTRRPPWSGCGSPPTWRRYVNCCCGRPRWATGGGRSRSAPRREPGRPARAGGARRVLAGRGRGRAAAIVARLREVACPVLVLTGARDAMAGTGRGPWSRTASRTRA